MSLREQLKARVSYGQHDGYLRLVAVAGGGVALCLGMVTLFTAHSDPPAYFYSLQADALLHGHLDIGHRLYDAAYFHGEYFLTFGLFPALMCLPFLAVFGGQLPDIALNIPTVLITTLALRRLWKSLGVADTTSRKWLTLITVLGTPYLAALVTNSAYFTADLIVCAAVAWALVLALERR